MSRQSALQKTTSNQIQVHPQQSATPQKHSQWSYLPAMDVLETEHEYTIMFDAPGLLVEQIDLTYKRDVVTLHAPVRQRNSEGIRFLRQEYGVGDFDRSIPLGELAEFIDGDRISASYEAGVLTIHLPKLERAQGRKIPVKAV